MAVKIVKLPEAERRDGILGVRQGKLVVITDSGAGYNMSIDEEWDVMTLFEKEMDAGEVCRVSFIPSPLKKGAGTCYAIDVLPRS